MSVGAPVIGLNDSGGARIQDGVDSLAGKSVQIVEIILMKKDTLISFREMSRLLVSFLKSQ